MPAALASLALLVGLTTWTGLGGATESPALRLHQESGDVEQRVVSACVAGLALATGNVAPMSPWPVGLREAVPPKGVAWRRIQAGGLMECSY